MLRVAVQLLPEVPDSRVARSRAAVPGADHAVVPEAVHVVVDLRQSLLEPDEARCHSEVELRTHCHVQVRSVRALLERVRAGCVVFDRNLQRVEALPLEVRDPVGSHFLFLVAADEVADALGSTRDLQTQLIAPAILDGREEVIVVHVHRREAVHHARRARRRHRGGGLLQQALDRRVGRRRTMTEDRVHRRVIVPVLHHALVGVDRPPRATRTPLLRRDDDDAVRRVGAVERRRARPLHDLDVLDLFRVDVRNATVRRTTDAYAAAGRVTPAAASTRHADAVDDVDGIVAQ